MMKAWPEDGSPASFDDIIDPILKAFRAGVVWQDKKSMLNRSIPWSGLPQGIRGLSLLPPDQWLTAACRRWDREEHGRDLPTILFCIAIQLGIEQGVRTERQHQESERALIRNGLSEAWRALRRLDADAGDTAAEETWYRNVNTEIEELERQLFGDEQELKPKRRRRPPSSGQGEAGP
jgi:hypothetical protein